MSHKCLSHDPGSEDTHGQISYLHSGQLGHAGPKLETDVGTARGKAGFPCVTLGGRSDGYAGGPVVKRGARASLLDHKQREFTVSSFGPQQWRAG